MAVFKFSEKEHVKPVISIVFWPTNYIMRVNIDKAVDLSCYLRGHAGQICEPAGELGGTS